MYGMDVADPVPIPLATYMTDKAPLWERMIEKYQLQAIPYEQVASWPFGDMIFGSGFDNISSTIKVRVAGFHSCIDTEHMFAGEFQKLADTRVIPPLR
jgi:hypothetical protein